LSEEPNLKKEYEAFLTDADNQDAIERALTIDFMLENEDQGLEAAHTRARSLWAHSRISPPELGFDESRRRWEVRFFEKDREPVPMRIERIKGRIRVRSMRKTPRERCTMEAAWGTKYCLSGPYLISIHAQRCADRKRAATVT
jgi:hypothetical protein